MLSVLKPYSKIIGLIVLLSVMTNGLSLYFPKKVGEYIDEYRGGNEDFGTFILVLGGLALSMLILSLIQYWVAVYASEKSALDLRKRLATTLKGRSFKYMREMSGGKLITLLTSDVDSVKNFIASGISSLLMAVITLIGVVIFLFIINWKMALLTLSVMPAILLVFAVIFKKMGSLFEVNQTNLDKINGVINESIIAAPLVRVLNARKEEINKFDVVNKKGTDIAMEVVTFFSSLIPIITLLGEAAVLIVLWFGGNMVITGELTYGELTAFLGYTTQFIWPFFILSFSSTYISKAQVSLKRIDEVIKAEEIDDDQKLYKGELKGNIKFDNVTLKYGDREILKNISFEIKPNTRTAIIGPTGAGKTELLYLLAGLVRPTEGSVTIDGVKISEWDSEALVSKMGIVFQESILFNTSFKENVLFKNGANEDMFQKAVDVAELSSLLTDLPEKDNTNISERGINLSGGQKQRLMLARALAINPTVLLLDDFTARVDAGTEERILNNIKANFEKLTLVSITQKIEPIKDYDHIIVLMEGELIDQGIHKDLLSRSIEYQQIYESQKTAH